MVATIHSIQEVDRWLVDLNDSGSGSGRVIDLDQPSVFEDAQPDVTRPIRPDPMLAYEDFNELCASLPATTHVVQWGGADVWKVGGKVFAIGGWSDDEVAAITFKVSADDFDMLTALDGVRPAPYLASRGMTWVQHYAAPGLDAATLTELIRESHRIVSLGLTKKLQRELGLNQTDAT